MIYTDLTREALTLACICHKGQVDKGRADYILHPFYVAEQMDTEIEVCVALLHDVIEDSSCSLNLLRDEKFPDEVIEAVDVLTRKDGDSYMDYVLKVKKNPIARKVKIADLEHNSDLGRLSKVDEEDLKRVKKYEKAMALLKEVDKDEQEWAAQKEETDET